MKTTETKFHFIGLGGAGCNMLEFFHQKGLKGNYTCITDPERKQLPKDIQFIHYCSPRDEKMRGILADMTVPLILPEEVKAVFSENRNYVLLAGLGSYTGTYMTEELAVWLQENNKDFMSICCMPFRFEDDLRKSHAERVENRFQHLPNFRFYELEAIREKHGNESFQTGIEIAHNEIYELFENELFNRKK